MVQLPKNQPIGKLAATGGHPPIAAIIFAGPDEDRLFWKAFRLVNLTSLPEVALLVTNDDGER